MSFLKRTLIVTLNLLLILLLLSAAVIQGGRSFLGVSLRPVPESQYAPQITSFVNEKWPGAKLIRRDAIHSEVHQDGKTVGRVVETLHASRHITGYGGPIPAALFLDEENRVTALRILDHSEDEDYLAAVEEEGVMAAWNGLTPEQARLKKVDTVTGATLSSGALIQSVRLSLAEETGNAAQEEPSSFGGIFWIALAALSLTIAAAVFVASRPQVRWAIWGMNLLVFGALGSVISLSAVMNRLSQGVFIGGSAVVALLLLSAFLMPILTGKAFYCVWICPFGILQEFAGRVFRWKIPIPRRIQKGLNLLRPALLGLLLMLWWQGIFLSAPAFEPFVIFSPAVSWGMFCFGAGIVALGLLIRRPWCRFVCPTGALIYQLEKIPSHPHRSPKEPSHDSL